MKNTFTVLTSILAACLLAVSPAVSQDWPMFHHDLAMSGYSDSDAPDTNNQLWEYNTGTVLQSSPAVVDGKLYIGGLNGILYAVDTSDGNLLWTFGTGANIHSSPAVAGGIVYFLAENGIMYAVDADTGILVWNAALGNGPWDWSSPAVSNGFVFIATSDGFMHKLDAATGAAACPKSYIGGTPDSPLSVVNGKVYSGTHNFDNSSPTIVALNEADLSIAWTYDYNLYHGGVVGMVNSNGAAIADGDGDGELEVYFGVYNWNGVGPQAVCLHENDGSEKWTSDVGGNSTSTPAVHGGKVFIGSDNGNIYALEAGTGAHLWSYATGGQVWSAPAVADGKVFAGSHDHTFYALDEASGALVWSYYTGASRMFGSPAVADCNLFFGNENGKIYAFGTRIDIPYAKIDCKLIRKYVAYSKTYLKINKECDVIGGDAGSNGDLDFKYYNIAYQNIRALGDVSVMYHSTVHGNVVAGGTLTQTSDSVIDGSAEDNVPGLAPYCFSVDEFSCGDEDLVVVDSVLDITPGKYRKMTSWGSKVILHSGVYFFDSISIRDGSLLCFEADEEPIIINVCKGILMYQSEAKSVSAEPCFGKILFNVRNVEGTHNIQIQNSNFLGTIIAPHSEAWLTPMAEVTGAVYAGKKLIVANGSILTFAPFGQPFECGSAKLAAAKGVENKVPEEYSLSQNFPNPFNPSTTIQFVIPAENTGLVTLKTYDIRGGLVRTLVDECIPPGEHSIVWDGTDENGRHVSSGIYIYRLESGDFSKSCKMMLMK